MIIWKHNKFKQIKQFACFQDIIFSSKELKKVFKGFLNYSIFVNVIKNFFSSMQNFIKEVTWNRHKRIKVLVSSLKCIKQFSLVSIKNSVNSFYSNLAILLIKFHYSAHYLFLLESYNFCVVKHNLIEISVAHYPNSAPT